MGDAGDGLPQWSAIPVLWRCHAGCGSVWRRGWDGLLGPAQNLPLSADMYDLSSSIQCDAWLSTPSGAPS